MTETLHDFQKRFEAAFHFPIAEQDWWYVLHGQLWNLRETSVLANIKPTQKLQDFLGNDENLVIHCTRKLQGDSESNPKYMFLKWDLSESTRPKFERWHRPDVKKFQKRYWPQEAISPSPKHVQHSRMITNPSPSSPPSRLTTPSRPNSSPSPEIQARMKRGARIITNPSPEKQVHFDLLTISTD